MTTDLDILDKEFKANIHPRVFWDCRFEELSLKKKQVFYDCSHPNAWH